MLEKFSRVSGVHGYSTRNRQHAYVIPKAKTRVYETSFYVLATLWNSLPTSVCLGISGEYISVNTFKCRLRGFSLRVVDLGYGRYQLMLHGGG